MAEEIKSPMAGKVISILVSVGDTIEEDDDIMLLEAMKMETTVFSSADGTVKEIKVQPGDKVDEEQTVMIVE